MKRVIIVAAVVICTFLICMYAFGGFSSAPAETPAPATAEPVVTATAEPTAEPTPEAKEAFKYVHDPRDNPNAMADIVENPDAIYGFSPDPESKRLGEYASYDWTNAEIVENARQERIAYHKELEGLNDMLEQLLDEGHDIEYIARAVSAERNRIRLASYDNDPEGLAKVKKSNLETYGDENGPTADSLYAKYGSWEIVLQKSFSPNLGMDACLGLYDDNYGLYCALGLAQD